MTQKEVLDSVKVRANQYQVAQNLPDPFILTQLNNAIRDVNTRAFPSRLDYYVVSGIDIINSPQLPVGILGGRPIRVLCTNPDDSSIIEARYAATPNEFWKIQANSINKAMKYQPMYFIGDDTTNRRTVKIWPTAIVTATADIWKLPDDLAITQADYTTVVSVPPGYETAVIYGTLYRCINKINEKQKLAEVFKLYNDTMSDLERNNAQRQQQVRQSQQALPRMKGVQQ